MGTNVTFPGFLLLVLVSWQRFPAFLAFFAGNPRFRVGDTDVFAFFCGQPLSLDGGSLQFWPFLRGTTVDYLPT